MKLIKVRINKYKSFLTEQNVNIDEKITRIVGKNESGKTAFLEALAKFHYFENDEDFIFNPTFDFPKNEWKAYQDRVKEIEVVNCTFKLDKELVEKIKDDIGSDALLSETFTYAKKYQSEIGFYNDVKIDEVAFLKHWLSKFDLPEDKAAQIGSVKTFKDLKTLFESAQQIFGEELIALNKEIFSKIWDNWTSVGDSYVAKNYLSPNLPVFWYFDEYYSLPSRIGLNYVQQNHTGSDFSKEELQISKALFELSKINISELNSASNFESFISELEATSNAVTDELFEYWSTNKNLEIKFEIEVAQDGKRYLNIRIRNLKHRVSLPLRNRSRGFIWFFSFLVWFSRIQNDRSKKYIILLDEPGLNLHASAQTDLLRFVEDKLSKNYQVIYTTHSPFMIDSSQLQQVRTVYDSLDPKIGSLISEAIQEKDPDTLFPLQAALGYDIAQNLYVSKNNLIVEGPADLVFLQIMSSLLEGSGRIFLKEEITIVPVGGLDKVSSFISLLRGSKLNLVCLLDTFIDQKGKRRVDDLIAAKIIKEKNVRFFDEFANIGTIAEIEDIFEKQEYLNLFNQSFREYNEIKISDLDSSIHQITKQICKIIGKERFNHYRPANRLSSLGVNIDFFSIATLSRFESMFRTINNLF